MNQDPQIGSSVEVESAAETITVRSANENADPLIGKVLGGRYRIDSVLGKGGMGTVYQAEQTLLQRQVAVKVSHGAVAADENARKRFANEGKATSSLAHPNLVTVHDYGYAEDGRPFIVMECFEGTNLDDIIHRDGKLASERFFSIFKQVCLGLSHAHKKGLAHRDLKPSNIIVTSDGGNENVKLVDFGIAKWFNSLEEQALTKTGEVYGTPAYMSPEQCLGNVLDSRSDIYSLGCVMFEALCGKPPFSGENAIEVAFHHINDRPPHLDECLLAPIVAARVDAIVAKCLAKGAGDRYQTVDELYADLTAAQDSSVEKARLSKRPRLAYVISLFVVVALIGAGLFVFMQRDQHSPLYSSSAVPVPTEDERYHRLLNDADQYLRGAKPNGELAARMFEQILPYAKLNWQGRPEYLYLLERYSQVETDMQHWARGSELGGELLSLRKLPDKPNIDTVVELRRLGYAETHANQLKQALEHLQTALSMVQKLPEEHTEEIPHLHMEIGRALNAQNEYEKAIPHLLLGRATTSTGSWFYEQSNEELGNAYEHLGKFKDAAASYREATRYNSVRPRKWHTRRTLDSLMRVLEKDHKTADVEKIKAELTALETK